MLRVGEHAVGLKTTLGSRQKMPVSQMFRGSWARRSTCVLHSWVEEQGWRTMSGDPVLWDLGNLEISHTDCYLWPPFFFSRSFQYILLFMSTWCFNYYFAHISCLLSILHFFYSHWTFYQWLSSSVFPLVVVLFLSNFKLKKTDYIRKM